MKLNHQLSLDKFNSHTGVLRGLLSFPLLFDFTIPATPFLSGIPLSLLMRRVMFGLSFLLWHCDVTNIIFKMWRLRLEQPSNKFSNDTIKYIFCKPTIMQKLTMPSRSMMKNSPAIISSKVFGPSLVLSLYFLSICSAVLTSNSHQPPLLPKNHRNR